MKKEAASFKKDKIKGRVKKCQVSNFRQSLQSIVGFIGTVIILYDFWSANIDRIWCDEINVIYKLAHGVI